MAGRGPQTFKKRQKEQQRKEKQEEKRARRLERRRGLGEEEPSTPGEGQDVQESQDSIEGSQPQPAEQ